MRVGRNGGGNEGGVGKKDGRKEGDVMEDKGSVR